MIQGERVAPRALRHVMLASALLVGSTATTGCSEASRDDAGEDEATDLPADPPAPSTRLYRLTHEQWENTVRDLFHLSEPVGLSARFRSDAREGGYLFDSSGVALEVDQALWNNYRGAAIELGELAVSRRDVFAAIVPPDDGDATTRARSFIERFGARAFRRPLRAEEVAAYEALFARGESLYSDASGFEAGVRVVIEAILQSPYFVYRVEESDTVEDDVIPLGEYELAAKLSYTLWNTMPDEALLAAASEGTLRRDLRSHAERMVADARARTIVQRFHEAVFQAGKFAALERSSTVFPGVPENLGELATEEFRRFVSDVVFAGDGGLVELLTSSQSHVNADLARIYGVSGSFGDAFEPALLPAGQRRGVLTQIGFLAANASATHPDPIHRGKLVLERIVCAKVPAPPNVIPPLPIPEGQTNRQAIEELTEQPGSTCAGCHSTFINPYGFPFENYDAIGAFRVLDNGLPIDSSSEVFLDDEKVPIANPFELIDALASSPAVHACYAKHWVEYFQGRPAVAEDRPTIDRLAETSLTEGLSIRELLVELVMSPAFQLRSAQELAP